MDIIAVSRKVTVSPRKVRLVADSIRNLSVEKALNALFVLDKRGRAPLEKTLKSAIANAAENAKIRKENLFIKMIDVLDGPALKRYHPSTRGRTHPYKKRTSHIKITLSEFKKEEKHGTKS